MVALEVHARDETRIGGNLRIHNNDRLTDLSSLPPFPTIEGDLGISGNDALHSLEGLHHLDRVEGSLAIEGNAGITDLQGLRELASIGGDLDIWSNITLNSLEGLEQLADEVTPAVHGALAPVVVVRNEDGHAREGLAHAPVIGGLTGAQ